MVVHELERHGWRVQNAYLGNPMRHDEKYLLINQGAAGKLWLMSYFNRQNNDGLILAIQFAGVERGRNGSTRTSPLRRIPNQRRTCWSIAQMAQMLLIRCILGVRSSHSMIFMGDLWVG